eukprot:scaffold451052_cov47-Prasinocladus_malaysianus.AAC.1
MELLRQVISRPEPTDIPALAMVLIEGSEGVGKSAVVNSLMSEALRHEAELGRAAEWVVMRASGDSQAPLMTCRNILRWILELAGELDAEALSWLL